MKLKASTLILGLCLAMLAVAASPAYARSTTGFSVVPCSRTRARLGTNPYTNACWETTGRW